MIISVIEKMKCNILSQQHTETWSVREASRSLGNDQVDSEVTFFSNIKQESGSSTSSDSGYEGCAVLQVSPVVEAATYCDVMKESCKCDLDDFVIVELGEFSNTTETCGCSCSSSKSVTYEPDFSSAELIAKELYRGFRRCWMLLGDRYQLASSLNAAGSIVVNEERVREDFESSLEVVQEIKLKSRIRGTGDWAPPRFQIIFNVHPPLNVTYEPDFSSAELIAKELYRGFRRCWMLLGDRYQLASSLNAAGSIVVNEERVREDFESSLEVVQEIKLKSRIRGTGDWAPPRFQIIFNVHPPLKRDLVVAAQNFFCAGCGTPIEPKFVRRLRYCEYLGKYFCDCCHSHAESCIPARILQLWDFRKYSVSNFSKRLLDSIWHQPVFNLLHVSRSLYTKAKELDRVREIQEQLFHVKKLLKTCRFAESALAEFEQVPVHLTDDLHLFSLEDLVKVKKGLLVPSLKDILKVSLEHVAGCELCQGKGFICEFCRSAAVIFPFQTATCRRCSACRACFHKQCFQSSQCPRCARITARRRLLESPPSAAT